MTRTFIFVFSFFLLPETCKKITGPDQGQIIDPTQTVPLHPHKLVSQRALSILAANLGQEWEALAIHMGIQRNRLYHFKEENKFSGWNQVFAFLTTWSNMRGCKATVEKLISELSSFETHGVSVDEYRHLFFE